jgi:16S rRNA (uracil1498-N3)-methyltransferase
VQRFLVPTGVLEADMPVLEGEVARQIAVVLRMRVGEQVLLFDGMRVDDLLCVLKAVTARRVACAPLHYVAGRREAALQLYLFPALLRAPRFEQVLQKATELGVAAITPLTCRRSVAQPSAEGVPERWRSIVREAAEQSGRSRLPALVAPVAFSAACAQSGQADMGLCCSEYGGGDLRSILAVNVPRSLAVLIGPEGGLEPAEVAEAERCGLQPITLGARILRAETAAIAVCAAAFCLAGDWQ